MTEKNINDLNEKQKATLRKILLLTSSTFIAISVFCFLNPDTVASLLNTDKETAALIPIIIGFIGIADFAIGFILFKSKDRV